MAVLVGGEGSVLMGERECCWHDLCRYWQISFQWNECSSTEFACLCLCKVCMHMLRLLSCMQLHLTQAAPASCIRSHLAHPIEMLSSNHPYTSSHLSTFAHSLRLHLPVLLNMNMFIRLQDPHFIVWKLDRKALDQRELVLDLPAGVLGFRLRFVEFLRRGVLF